MIDAENLLDDDDTAFCRPAGLGHDPDDSVALPVECDVSSQNPRVSAEAGLPQSVAQDDDLGRAGFALFGQEVTAYGGLYPQNLEIVAGNLKAANPLGLGYGSKLEALVGVRSKVLEGVVLLPVVEEIRYG